MAKEVAVPGSHPGTKSTLTVYHMLHDLKKLSKTAKGGRV